MRVKGLASKILALSARQMPRDWETRYGYRPLLLETLVDAARFRGTCYRAANWIHVGQTAGRGRMDRDQKLTVKPSKTSISTRWCETHGSDYAAISRGKQIRFFFGRPGRGKLTPIKFAAALMSRDKVEASRL